jgi:hypothetical protein
LGEEEVKRGGGGGDGFGILGIVFGDRYES